MGELKTKKDGDFKKIYETSYCALHDIKDDKCKDNDKNKSLMCHANKGYFDIFNNTNEINTNKDI